MQLSMKEQIYFRNAVGDLVAWRRTHIRVLTNGTPGPAGTTKPADEKFLEDLVASRPDLLGIGGWDDETDIEGPFHAFRQLSLHALNGRSIAPDLVLLSRSGHIVVVEVKLSDNPELRDRQVVAQLLEYAASFAQYTEDECLALFGGKACGVATWAAFVQTLFPRLLNVSRTDFSTSFAPGNSTSSSRATRHHGGCVSWCVGLSDSTRLANTSSALWRSRLMLPAL